jgi:hypothetical protein
LDKKVVTKEHRNLLVIEITGNCILVHCSAKKMNLNAGVLNKERLCFFWENIVE